MAAPKKKPASKKSTKPTMRELAKSSSSPKKRTLKEKSSSSLRPLKRLRRKSDKKRKLPKLPDNRLGRILDKILFALPRYFKNSWKEIRLTTWPGRRETIRLTFAVFIFSTVFAVFVAVLDFGLDKLFKHLVTK